MERKEADPVRENRSVPDRQPDTDQGPSSSKPEGGGVDALHREIGNQAVQQLYEKGELQAKLEVSQPGDEHEREAERAAERVMGTSIPDTSAAPADDLQRESTSTGAPTVEREAKRRIESLKGGGQPLPPSIRSFFEPRFGRDFSDVRVHTGAEADESARSINAEAFTHGNDVVFRSGKYDPSSHQGKKLIAHELAHVTQQARDHAPAVQRQSESRQESDGQSEWGSTVTSGGVEAVEERWDETAIRTWIDGKARDAGGLASKMETAAESFENWYQEGSVPQPSKLTVAMEVVTSGLNVTAAVFPPSSSVALGFDVAKNLLSASREVQKAEEAAKETKALGVEQAFVSRADALRDEYRDFASTLKENNYNAFYQIGLAIDYEMYDEAEQLLHEKGGVPDPPAGFEKQLLAEMIHSFRRWKMENVTYTGSAEFITWAIRSESQRRDVAQEEARSQLEGSGGS